MYALVMGGINPEGNGGCGMVPYNPPHCSGIEAGSITEGMFDIPCGRGSAIAGLVLPLVLSAIIISPIIMITCLAMIYRCVLVTERSMSKYGARSMLKASTFFIILGLLK